MSDDLTPMSDDLTPLCEWVYVVEQAAGTLFCCQNCGLPVIPEHAPGWPVHQRGDIGTYKRVCSGEFGRFDNVTSREADDRIAELETAIRYHRQLNPMAYLIPGESEIALRSALRTGEPT